MLICAIETSGAVGSLALGDGERVLSEATFEKGLRHGQALIPSLARCLEQAGLEKHAIDLYVAGTGPGSYTGLRVGIATAKGLALALRKPLIGVPSFDAIAAAVPADALSGARSLVVATDARRDRLYFAAYDASTRATFLPPEVRRAERLFEGAPEPLVLAGYALDAYPALREGRRFVEAHPHARDLLPLAAAAYRTRPENALHTVQPLYLRAGLAAEDSSS